MNNLIVIENTVIRQDAAGRYCLNDLHRAAGGERRHEPSFWRSLQQTESLVQFLSDTGIPVSAIRGGADQGTYVCKELVYSYAMWISAAFNLKVIRTFDAVKTGKSDFGHAFTQTRVTPKGIRWIAERYASELMVD